MAGAPTLTLKLLGTCGTCKHWTEPHDGGNSQTDDPPPQAWIAKKRSGWATVYRSRVRVRIMGREGDQPTMTTKPTKRTSDRVSRIAAEIMAMSHSEWTPYIEFYELRTTRAGRFRKHGRMDITDEVLALAASCLAQDEHRGKRKAKRKSARKGKR